MSATFDLKSLFGLLAVVIGLSGYYFYIKDVWRGTTRPSFVSWLLWTLLSFTVSAALYIKGAGAAAWLPGLSSLLCLVTALLGLKNPERKIFKLDLLCFVLAIAALIPWQLTDDPTLSLILITLIEFLAFVPTIRKTLKFPDSETLISYFTTIVSYLLNLLAVAEYSFATIFYPVMIIVYNLLVALIILRVIKAKASGC